MNSNAFLANLSAIPLPSGEMQSNIISAIKRTTIIVQIIAIVFFIKNHPFLRTKIILLAAVQVRLPNPDEQMERLSHTIYLY